MGAAFALQSSELALTEDQAATYAKAAHNVAKHYPVRHTAKALAWVNLMAAAGGIYWSKYKEISARKAAEKIAQVRAANAGVPRAAMAGV